MLPSSGSFFCIFFPENYKYILENQIVGGKKEVKIALFWVTYSVTCIVRSKPYQRWKGFDPKSSINSY
jgi:hypothetical protein